MIPPNIDPIRTAKGAGQEIFARNPRASLVVIGKLQERDGSPAGGPIERWTVTEKLDHLILGEEVAEFATPEEAMAGLRAHRRLQRERARHD